MVDQGISVGLAAIKAFSSPASSIFSFDASARTVVNFLLMHSFMQRLANAAGLGHFVINGRLQQRVFATLNICAQPVQAAQGKRDLIYIHDPIFPKFGATSTNWGAA
jgi:hypothetical protein